MRQAGESIYGDRLRGADRRALARRAADHETLSLAETDLEERRGAMLVRHGKGDKRREVGMDDWGFEQLRAWLARRATMPVGTLFCKIDGPSPHQLRHAHAIEMAREGVPLNIIQRQLGHTDLGVTSSYLQGIDSAEIVNASTLEERR